MQQDYRIVSVGWANIIIIIHEGRAKSFRIVIFRLETVKAGLVVIGRVWEFSSIWFPCFWGSRKLKGEDDFHVMMWKQPCISGYTLNQKHYLLIWCNAGKFSVQRKVTMLFDKFLPNRDKRLFECPSYMNAHSFEAHNVTNDTKFKNVIKVTFHVLFGTYCGCQFLNAEH